MAAPMPATVVSIAAPAGTRVTAGDPVVVLEAMKMELVIRAEGSTITVQPLPEAATHTDPETEEAQSETPKKKQPQSSSTRLAEDIGIRLLYVNFKDYMESPEAHVRFFSNGTSDEFTILFFSHQGERKISLDVVTGLAQLEVIR
jgi:hypothetical protein